ncbi:MAG: tetratricopeptide repeat protein [Leptolyngbya sp. BL-A-14]
MHVSKLGALVFLSLLATGLAPVSHRGSSVTLLPAQAQTQTTRELEADQLFDQGVQQYQQNQFEAAVQSWQQALTIDRSLKNRQREGITLGNLGNAYLSLENYGKAIAYQQQSLAIARELKNRQGESAALGGLGNAYYALGADDKAIEAYQQSLMIARELKNPQSEERALDNLGNVYQRLGAYDKAIDAYQQSLTIARTLKDPRREGRALDNLGNVYQRMGKYDQAVQYLQQSLAMARSRSSPQGETRVLSNLGSTYYALGYYNQAIAYYQQALAIARTIKNQQSEETALSNLGNAYFSLKNYAQAIEVYQQWTKLAQASNNPQSKWFSLNNLGFALYHSGQAAAAEKPLLDAIAILESQRKGLKEAEQISLLETRRNPYITLQQVKVALNKPTEALEIAEQGRARTFVEQLCKRFSPVQTTFICTYIPSIKLPQMQQVARMQGATLVEYAIIPGGRPSLYIWVVQPSGEVSFRQTPLKILDASFNFPVSADDRGGTATALAEVIRGTLDTLGAIGRNAPPSPRADQTAETKRLKDLYQQLIAPIANQLPTDPEQPVIFIPQGPLFQVPFAALQDDQSRALIEQHTIVSAPSIQALSVISQSPAGTRRPATSKVAGKSRNVLVVGNPSVSSVVLGPGKEPQALPPLPGSEREAKQIAALLNTQPLLGKAATKAAVLPRLANANIIHLATHGFLDDVKGVGIPGAIALTPTKNPSDNGLLTADEILTQKLQADLVVLSACDSGRGRITGDGVIGLSRAFLTVGASSVVVSLWKVPDVATAALMKEFYQQWQGNQTLGKARALRQAILKTKKEYPDPLSWSAFTLIGLPK